MKMNYHIYICLSLVINLVFVRVSAQNVRSAYDNSAPKERANKIDELDFRPRVSEVKDSLPIEFIDGVKEIGNTENKMSLRNDYPYTTSSLQQSPAIPYPTVREEDIIYKIRVWRDIDLRERENRFLMFAKNEFGTHNLINIIIDLVKTNKITAFSNENDRFTTPLKVADALAEFSGGLDTVATYNEYGDVSGYQVRRKAIDPDSVYTFRIKEDWFFDKAYGRMMSRIIGIAPVISYRSSTGEILPNSEHAVFWLYYNDLRPLLSKYQTINPRMTGARMQMNEALDQNAFKALIVKSDYENPGEVSWNVLYPNPEDQDLEREKILNIMKNFENSLWPKTPEMTKEDIENQKKKKGVKIK